MEVLSLEQLDLPTDGIIYGLRDKVPVPISNTKSIFGTYPTWNLTTLNTWRSWGRNSSNILAVDANGSLGTGATPSSFADYNFISVQDCKKLSKLVFTCREPVATGVTVQLFVQSFDLTTATPRGLETNLQTLVNEVVPLAVVSTSTMKNNFTISNHNLNASSGLFVAYRITSGTGVTIQGVSLEFIFEQ